MDGFTACPANPLRAAHYPQPQSVLLYALLCSALLPTNGRHYGARENQYPAACPSLRLSDAP